LIASDDAAASSGAAVAVRRAWSSPGSVRTNQFFRGLPTELRLGFLAAPDVKALPQPYAPRNAMILELLEAGNFSAARDELEKYLKEAEEQVVAAVVADETGKSR
jgi:hypothetical protein